MQSDLDRNTQSDHQKATPFDGGCCKALCVGNFSMTKERQTARKSLRKLADEISDEVWQGKWDHIPNLNGKVISEWTKVLEELEKRCPGHTKEGYEDALARSHFTRR